LSTALSNLKPIAARTQSTKNDQNILVKSTILKKVKLHSNHMRLTSELTTAQQSRLDLIFVCLS